MREDPKTGVFRSQDTLNFRNVWQTVRDRRVVTMKH